MYTSKLRPIALSLAVFAASACSEPLTRGALGLGTLVPDGDDSTAAWGAYRLHAPASCSPDDPRPLVVAFHGAFSSPAEMEEESGLSDLADREGFIVVYPYGSGFLGLLQHWNSGHCCGPAQENDVDDVAFTRRVIAAVEAEVAVDPSRIYLVGMSNGAMMVHRAAAELSEVVAAAAAVSGTIGGRPSEDAEVWRVSAPPRPVPILIMHGDADEIVPWDGGMDTFGSEGRTFLGVDETVAFWRRTNGVDGAPGQDTLEHGRISRTRWQGETPDSEVVLYRVADWPHAWPGGEYTRDLPADDPLSGFEAADLIWPFLVGHTRPPRNADDGATAPPLRPCLP